MILLVDPGAFLTRFKKNPFVNRGLLSIASYLRINGFSCDFLPLEHYVTYIGELKAILFDFLSKKEYSIVGISNLFISEYELSLEISKIVKDYNPEIITVFGGYYPTFYDDVVLNSSVDYVVRSEGEFSFLQFVKNTFDGKSVRDLPNLTYSIKGKIQSNSVHCGDLNALPVIDYSILPTDYLYRKRGLNINIEFSRGCYFNCSICSVRKFWQESMRHHSLNKIFEELKYLKDNKFEGEVSIEDSSVNISDDHHKELLAKLIENSIFLNYSYITTWYKFLDEVSLSLIARLGFKEVLLGLESTSQKVQRYLNKPINIKEFVSTLKLVKKHSIKNNVFIIIGLPGDTKESLNATYSFVKNYIECGLITSVFVTFFLPYEGLQATKLIKLFNGSIKSNVHHKDWVFRSEPIVEYPDYSIVFQKEMFQKFLDLNSYAKSDFIHKF